MFVVWPRLGDRVDAQWEWKLWKLTTMDSGLFTQSISPELRGRGLRWGRGSVFGSAVFLAKHAFLALVMVQPHFLES